MDDSVNVTYVTVDNSLTYASVHV